jgi:hypothetical protein
MNRCRTFKRIAGFSEGEYPLHSRYNLLQTYTAKAFRFINLYTITAATTTAFFLLDAWDYFSNLIDKGTRYFVSDKKLSYSSKMMR